MWTFLVWIQDSRGWLLKFVASCNSISQPDGRGWSCLFAIYEQTSELIQAHPQQRSGRGDYVSWQNYKVFN